MIIPSDATLSVRISSELKKAVKELGIEPSRTVRRALEEEVKRRKAEQLQKKIAQVQSLIREMSSTVVDEIRRDRGRT